jgi:hypothetical protein
MVAYTVHLDSNVGAYFVSVSSHIFDIHDAGLIFASWDNCVSVAEQNLNMLHWIWGGGG